MSRRGPALTEELRVRAAMGDVLAGVGLWEEAAAVHASVLKVCVCVCVCMCVCVCRVHASVLKVSPPRNSRTCVSLVVLLYQ
jgi:hypothetical protein